MHQLGSTSLFAAHFRRERRPRAAAAAPPSRCPHSALAAAQALGRPAQCRLALPFVPHPSGNLSRVHSRHLRSPRARRAPRPHRERHRPRLHRGLGASFALCRLAALRLRRQLHLRWRCAPGRAPRAGPVHRSVAAAGTAGRRRLSRASRCRRAARGGEPPAVARSQPSRAQCRRNPRSAACVWAISPPKSCACAAKTTGWPRVGVFPTLGSSTRCCKRAAYCCSPSPESPAMSPSNTPRSFAMPSAFALPADLPATWLAAQPEAAARTVEPLRAQPRPVYPRRSCVPLSPFQIRRRSRARRTGAAGTPARRRIPSRRRAIASGYIPRSCSSFAAALSRACGAR